MDRARVTAMIASAVDDNRVDLYLQPIVSLPQRKVRFYEAVARMRSEDGEVLSPSDFVPFAEAGGLMPKIDNLILFRCVQVVRRLASKNRDIGVFCDISGPTLNDPEFYPQLSDFMQANRALAPSLVLEFSQNALRHMGPIETESLAALAALGFRFSLDRLTDLRVEPRDLADRAFRFVKAPAALLLNRTGMQGSDIHPADFSDLLGRFGIDLIADQIESESTVVDLLDYDVRFGQGILFSPPRPVRTEALEMSERSETARRDNPAVQARQSRDTVPAVQPGDALAPEQRPDRRAGMLAQLARGVVRRA
jgi:cyclic-di-GMP phosphodiesterase TipF (flagellum assembly factor)